MGKWLLLFKGTATALNLMPETIQADTEVEFGLILASLQILPQLASPAAPLQAPRVIMDPQHPVYFPGERLTLRCLAPGGEAVSSYQFYNQRGERVYTETTGLSGGPWLVLMAEMGKAGVYSWPSVLLETFRPTLQLSPTGSEFTTGDSVTLTCSAPSWEKKMGFCFLKAGAQVACTRQALEDSQSYQIGRLSMEDTGSYTCMYQVAEPGQEISSLESQPISITVTAPPLAPRLSLHPKLPVYLPGEKVTLTCSVPHGKEVAGFRFHQHRGDQTPEELPAASGGPWMELMAQMGNDGSYTCQYWRREAGQEIVSENSNSITVPVSDPPPQSELSVDPPSGVVGEGLPLLITCTAPEDASERRFHFYKDGAELIPRDVGSEISTGTGSMNVSVVSIPQAGPKSLAEFTCGYEKNISGRWILSHRSRAVNVTVTAKASPGFIQDLELSTSSFLELESRSCDKSCKPPVQGLEAEDFAVTYTIIPMPSSATPPVPLSVR
ncbi:unnamed protein product [Caretta caretta]